MVNKTSKYTKPNGHFPLNCCDHFKHCHYYLVPVTNICSVVKFSVVYWTYPYSLFHNCSFMRTAIRTFNSNNSYPLQSFTSALQLHLTHEGSVQALSFSSKIDFQLFIFPKTSTPHTGIFIPEYNPNKSYALLVIWPIASIHSVITIT